MKTEKEILAEIKRLASDGRVQQKPATVFENAPLAIIQTEIESKVTALEWVLEITGSHRVRLPSAGSTRGYGEKKM